jgi:hypothetical protein
VITLIGQDTDVGRCHLVIVLARTETPRLILRLQSRGVRHVTLEQIRELHIITSIVLVGSNSLGISFGTKLMIRAYNIVDVMRFIEAAYTCEGAQADRVECP